jgi:hypothetical protein
MSDAHTVAVIFPQLTILLILGASFDFLFGFNRTDYGFTTLLFLFVAAPIVDFSWLLSEIVISIRQAKHRDKTMSFLMPGIALLFFIESIIIDIFLLSQARM